MNTRWTDADLMAHQARMGKRSVVDAEGHLQPSVKPSKHRNVKTVVDGITFHSKREAQYWQELRIRERVGDISELRRQVPYQLLAPVLGSEGLSVQVSEYRADYIYIDREGKTHVVDAKGHRTQMFMLKAKWLELQSGIVIEEV